MGEFIYFTEEQKERANTVSIADILQKEHEEAESACKSDTREKTPKRNRNVLFPPEKNDTMKRVYAYLMQKRHISRETLTQNGYKKIQILGPVCKDWNEDLKNLHGEEAAPAQEHPKIAECGGWISILKPMAESVDAKYATKQYICRYYQEIYNALKKGRENKYLEEAFDEAGMLLAGVLVRCMEKEGRALGKETDTVQILDNLQKRYRPHQDKGNFHTRIRNMQKAFSDTMEVFDTKDLSLKENKELLVKKCMGLTMECIRAHIFVAVDYQEPVMGQAHGNQNTQESGMEAQNKRGMALCSQ